MNYTKELVDRFKMTKWRVRKLCGVSWNTVNFWYRGIYNPNEKHQKILEEKYNDMIRKNP